MAIEIGWSGVTVAFSIAWRFLCKSSISLIGSANIRTPSGVVRSVSWQGKVIIWLKGMPSMSMRPQPIWIRRPSGARSNVCEA